MALNLPTLNFSMQAGQFMTDADRRKLEEDGKFWRAQHAAGSTAQYLNGPRDKLVYLYMQDTNAHVPIPLSRLHPGMLFRVTQHSSDDLLLCLNAAYQDKNGDYQMNAVPFNALQQQSTTYYQVPSATTTVNDANIINASSHTSTMIDIEKTPQEMIDPESCVAKDGNGTQAALYEWYKGTHMHLHILIMCVFAAYRDALAEGFDEEDAQAHRLIVQRHIAKVEYPETLNVDQVAIHVDNDVHIDVSYNDKPREHQETLLVLFPSRVSVSTKEKLPYGASVNLGTNGVPCIIDASTIMEDLASDTWRYGKDE